MLVGSIPFALYQLTNLATLYLEYNQLEGSIPPNVQNLNNLRTFIIDNNSFTGPIPSEIGNLGNHEYLSLSGNNFTGAIPYSIGNLSKLKSLFLDSNIFEGSVPKEIGNLGELVFLYLSQNELSGSIPAELGNCKNLSDLDISYNNLSGVVPCDILAKLTNNTLKTNINIKMFEGNEDLLYHSCPQQTKRGQTPYHIKVVLPVVMSSFFLILGCLLLSRFETKNKQIGSETTTNGDLCSIWNYDGKIAYEDIIAATEDFDIRYCIGTGGYGSVYKAQLPCGKVVSLKKLHRLETEDPVFDKSFKNGVKILSEIRHRNIVKLHGYCLHRRCMFLIYEYMERGSLFWVLSNEVEAVDT